MFGFLKRLFQGKKQKPPQRQESKKVAPPPLNIFATGNFEHFSLYDIMVVFSSNHKAAKITIAVKGRRAMIHLSNGYLELAMYHAWMGREAVLHIFSDIEDDAQAQFLIKPHTPQLPAGKGIKLEPLLKEVAQMLDKKRSTIPV
ncbi:MAG: DUF4388 domain-containing protein [Trueperaceae bacterium]|nr:DUF4388 domain-containing protein [Trueperaceae bacterium]